MNLAISNIAWQAADDKAVYALCRQYGFTGLEIAPTRIFPEAPYEHLAEVPAWCEALRKEELTPVCMQSVWYGRTENLFASEEERNTLLAYTAQAVTFAKAAGISRFVFGCPKNRNIPEGHEAREADSFFRAMGACAFQNGVSIALEANPPVYGTNFLNRTEDVLSYLEELGADGLGLNLDTGAMIENGETVRMLEGKLSRVVHVHISEPRLVPVRERELHGDVLAFLKEEGYKGCVSIEMAHCDDLRTIESVMAYVRKLADEV